MEPMSVKSSTPSLPTLKPLSVNDLLFVNAYLSNGRNATQAYRTVHPKVTLGSAEVLGIRRLGNIRVQQEIATRLEAQGWSKEKAVSACLDVQSRAQAKGDLSAELRSITELNDLAGLKVHRVEDVTPKDAAQSLTDAELQSRLAQRLRELTECHLIPSIN